MLHYFTVTLKCFVVRSCLLVALYFIKVLPENKTKKSQKKREIFFFAIANYEVKQE